MGQIGMLASLVCIYIALSQYRCCGSTVYDVQRLHTDLLANYSKYHRPVNNHTECLNIDVAMYVLSILTLDEKSNVIELCAGIMVQWADYRLTWDPSSYGGIEEYLVPPSSVWHPDLSLISSAEGLKSFGSDEFKMILSYNGTIIWAPGQLIKSSCVVDMTNYPTDVQTCTMILIPMGYHSADVSLTPMGSTFNMDYFTPNGEWEVTSTSSNQYTQFLPRSHALSFTMKLRRKYLYLLIFLMIPLLIICFLNTLTFFVPSSSGRMSYTVNLFLALAIYSSMITDRIPRNSSPMAGMSYFLLTTLFFSIAIGILTIITLRFEAMDLEDFPKWIVRFSQFTKRPRKKVSPVIEKEGASEEDSSHTDELTTKDKDEKGAPSKTSVMKFIDTSCLILSFVSTFIMTVSFFGIYIRF